jgi:phenylalanyl-tRNA synthetase alpha chain
MREEIINIKNEAIAQITEAKEVSELETFKINYLGRNGKINDLLKGIKDVSAEDRKDIGILLNEAKQTIASLIVEQENKLRENTREWFDPTVPGIEPKTGHLHLVTQAIREISNGTTLLLQHLICQLNMLRGMNGKRSLWIIRKIKSMAEWFLLPIPHQDR